MRSPRYFRSGLPLERRNHHSEAMEKTWIKRAKWLKLPFLRIRSRSSRYDGSRRIQCVRCGTEIRLVRSVGRRLLQEVAVKPEKPHWSANYQAIVAHGDDPCLWLRHSAGRIGKPLRDRRGLWAELEVVSVTGFMTSWHKNFPHRAAHETRQAYNNRKQSIQEVQSARPCSSISFGSAFVLLCAGTS